MNSIFNSPPYVFIRFALEQVQSLCHSGNTFSIEIYRCFIQVIFIVRKELINFISCNVLVNTKLTWLVGSKGVEHINQFICPLFFITFLWMAEELIFRIEKDLFYFKVEIH